MDLHVVFAIRWNSGETGGSKSAKLRRHCHHRSVAGAPTARLRRARERCRRARHVLRTTIMWGLSRSRRATLSVAAALASLLGAACSGSTLTESCGVVGRQQACECSGSAVGIQTCQLDGSWECTCYFPGGGSSAANSVAGRTSSMASGLSTDEPNSAEDPSAGSGGVGDEAQAGSGGRSTRTVFPFGGRRGFPGGRR